MSYCAWSRGNTLLENYHDTEWGVPVKDDRVQFEYLMLEAMQCGLSWMLMLKKREIFRACFDGFDAKKVADYTETDVERILGTEGMIRFAPKIRAVIGNARHFLEIAEEFGSFWNYLCSFAGEKTILYDGHADGYIPASNGLSDRIAADLKKRGFKYLGSITVYSHLQSCGIINDHGRNCPCYARINSSFPTVHLPAETEHHVICFA